MMNVQKVDDCIYDCSITMMMMITYDDEDNCR